MRACSSSSKYAPYYVLEKEEICGKNWGTNGFAECCYVARSFKASWLELWTINISHLTQKQKHARRHAPSAEQNNLPSFIALPVLVSPFLSPNSGTLHHHFCEHYRLCFNFFTKCQPLDGQVLLLMQFHDCTQTHHTRYVFPGRVFSKSQGTLLEKVLNGVLHVLGGLEPAQCHQVNGSRPTP